MEESQRSRNPVKKQRSLHAVKFGKMEYVVAPVMSLLNARERRVEVFDMECLVGALGVNIMNGIKNR